MKELFILCSLLLLASCNMSRQTKVKETIPGSRPGLITAEEAEEKLRISVNQFLQLNKLDTSGNKVLQPNSSLIRPVIAVNDQELNRLKTAWNSSGTEHDLLASRFAQAENAIREGITFPPEGGQHNQWYQCDSCQRGLKTIDDHHHECPSCKRIYSGFPYDNVLYSRHHSRNLRLAEDAAWAWAVTGEKKYADFSAAVLLGYADRYLNYPMLHASVNDKSIDVAAGKNDKYRTAGHISEQTLGEASLMIPVATAYDLIYNSGVLTDKQKYHIENQFILAMAECINGYKAGKSNWQTWHNAALLYAGAVTGNGRLIRQALLDKENGFIAQMKVSVLPEGMWYENSWGYHYYTLSAMTHLAEGGRHLGFDLYSHPLLKKMYLLPFDYLMSDGSLPRFGDAVQDSPGRSGLNLKAYKAYGDERLISYMSSGPSWDKILLGHENPVKPVQKGAVSRLIPGAGHAILATNGPGKLTAAITFGPYGGFHGHFDKLSFVFFGYGQELGVDPGRAASQAYRLPIHQQWYKASTGHNVVLADGRSQKEAEGKCLAFNSDISYAAVTADAGPAFSNISHKRFMLLSPHYLFIVDELKSEDGKEHTFDWLYHNKGQSVSCNLPSGEGFLGTSPQGYDYLKDILAYRPDSDLPIRMKISGEKTDLLFTMQGQEKDEIFTATGPFASIEDRVPLIIVRRKGNLVRFAVLLEPVPTGKGSSIKKLEALTGTELNYSIIYEGGEDFISFSNDKLESFRIEQKKDSERKLILRSY